MGLALSACLRFLPSPKGPEGSSPVSPWCPYRSKKQMPEPRKPQVSRGGRPRPAVPWAPQSRDRPLGGGLRRPLGSPQPSPPWALSLCMQRAEGPQIWAEPWNLDGTSGEAGGRPGPLGYHGVTVPPAPPACGVPVARSLGSPDGMSLSASSRACSSEDTGCPVVRAPGCPLGPLVPQGEGDRGPLQLCSTRS